MQPTATAPKTNAVNNTNKGIQGGQEMLSTAEKNPVHAFTGGGNGKHIVDARGDEVAPVRHGLMATLNAASKEDVTLTKGTLVVIGSLIAMAGLLITCGVLFVGWVRDDQSNRVNQGVMQKEMEEMRQDMKEMKTQFTELQKTLQAQAVKDAESKGKAMGYEVGRTDQNAKH